MDEPPGGTEPAALRVEGGTHVYAWDNTFITILHQPASTHEPKEASAADPPTILELEQVSAPDPPSTPEPPTTPAPKPPNPNPLTRLLTLLSHPPRDPPHGARRPRGLPSRRAPSLPGDVRRLREQISALEARATPRPSRPRNKRLVEQAWEGLVRLKALEHLQEERALERRQYRAMEEELGRLRERERQWLEQAGRSGVGHAVLDVARD